MAIARQDGIFEKTAGKRFENANLHDSDGQVCREIMPSAPGPNRSCATGKRNLPVFS